MVSSHFRKPDALDALRLLYLGTEEEHASVFAGHGEVALGVEGADIGEAGIKKGGAQIGFGVALLGDREIGAEVERGSFEFRVLSFERETWSLACENRDLVRSDALVGIVGRLEDAGVVVA